MRRQNVLHFLEKKLLNNYFPVSLNMFHTISTKSLMFSFHRVCVYFMAQSNSKRQLTALNAGQVVLGVKRLGCKLSYLFCHRRSTGKSSPSPRKRGRLNKPRRRRRLETTEQLLHLAVIIIIEDYRVQKMIRGERSTSRSSTSRILGMFYLNQDGGNC